jgi:acyl-coenzyme A thioesterase PaaI-like protein
MARLLADPETLRDPQEKQFELDGWIDTAPFEDLVGITIETAREGRAVLSLTTLADTAVAMAIKSLLPPGTIFATTELTIRFLAPVREGRMTATAEVTGPEGRTFRGEAAVIDAEGREAVRVTSVFRVARGQGIGE